MDRGKALRRQTQAILDRNSIGQRLSRQVGASASYSISVQVLAGVAAAALAVTIRTMLPLHPSQIPTLPLVITLAITTSFVGMWCGITTAVVGGFLSFPLFLHPRLATGDGWVPLVSYVIISTVIVTTSQLYRSSEQQRYQGELDRLRVQAENADLFAREMGHRLKNTLAIVQSIAYQTIGTESAEASKFANRLRALADANDLLNEHVSRPDAELRDVLTSALRPFDEGRNRFEITNVSAKIPSQQVLMLALAIHELATNASKYGSLSNKTGVVVIQFEHTGGGLTMTWRERGGPPVTAPVEHGFGTRLLRRTGAKANLDFAPEGLTCSIEVRAA